jgi:hypothetical protein
MTLAQMNNSPTRDRGGAWPSSATYSARGRGIRKAQDQYNDQPGDQKRTPTLTPMTLRNVAESTSNSPVDLPWESGELF